MQYIIDGKKYDTETSRRLCRYASGKSGWGSCKVSNLYVTENGNFFLEVKEEDIITEKVVAFTENEARKFMARHAAGVDVVMYEQIFGEAEKG